MYLPIGEIRGFILNKCHDSRYAGNLGMKKTEELIQRDFFWPTLHQDVISYIQTYEECQRNKVSNQRSAGLLQPLEVPSQHWERVSMDFITHILRTRAGYDSLLVIVDYITKMMILRFTHSAAMAVDVGRHGRHSRSIPQHNVARQIRCCRPSCSSGSVLSYRVGQCSLRTATNVHKSQGTGVESKEVEHHLQHARSTHWFLTHNNRYPRKPLHVLLRCKGTTAREKRASTHCARLIYTMMMLAAVLARGLIGTC